MTKTELEKYRLEHRLKLIFFIGGLSVAFILALFNSPYTPVAFTFIGGLMGGSALERKI